MRAFFLLVAISAAYGAPQQGTHIEGSEYFANFKNGMNNFALELSKLSLEHADGNVISSPFSVYMVLAMASFGSYGKTLEEFHKVLHMPGMTAAHFANDIKCFRKITDDLHTLGPVVLDVGNKIFVDSHLPLRPWYTNLAEAVFSSDVTPVAFSHPETAAERINSWCTKFTHGKINEIVSSNDLDPDTQLMLLNAIYFKGDWQEKFNKQLTENLPFHINERHSEIVPTMFNEGSYEVGDLPELDAEFVVLPYNNGEYDVVAGEPTYMYFIVPKEVNGLAKIQRSMEQLTLEQLHNKTRMYITLSVPKFKVESSLELSDDLIKLGLRDGFSDSANFYGMTFQRHGLQISRIVQKAFIEVNEEGTEASAATGTLLVPLMLPPTPERHVKIDRPFLMILATEDLILFTGKVVNPVL